VRSKDKLGGPWNPYSWEAEKRENVMLESRGQGRGNTH
jgi:hypothetical protein